MTCGRTALLAAATRCDRGKSPGSGLIGGTVTIHGVADTSSIAPTTACVLHERDVVFVGVCFRIHI